MNITIYLVILCLCYFDLFYSSEENHNHNSNITLTLSCKQLSKYKHKFEVILIHTLHIWWMNGNMYSLYILFFLRNLDACLGWKGPGYSNIYVLTKHTNSETAYSWEVIPEHSQSIVRFHFKGKLLRRNENVHPM